MRAHKTRATPATTLHEDLSRGQIHYTASARSFGLVFGSALAAFGLAPLVGGEPARVWLLIAATAFIALALLRPALLDPLNAGWRALALVLGRIVSPIVLAIIFILVFVPAGLLARVFRRLSIVKKPDARVATYWVERAPRPPQHMTRQF